MSVEAFFQRLSEVLFFAVFIATTVDAVRRPRRSKLDIERYDRLLAAHQGRLIESGPGFGRLIQ